MHGAMIRLTLLYNLNPPRPKPRRFFYGQSPPALYQWGLESTTRH